MTASEAQSLRAMADALAGTFPCCDDGPLALALLRELARGEPVPATALAAAAGRDNADATAALARWPNVKLDADGSVVAFSGLSLRPTAHHVQVDSRPLYAWCAWDTLFLPALLDQPARVRSRCPVSDADVRLTVEPSRRGARARPRLASGFLPAARRGLDVGHHQLVLLPRAFPRRPGRAERRLADHEGARVLTLDEAFELRRLATRPLLTSS